MGDGTADGVRVDSLAEWQAAAEEVRRLERVAQGRREVLLSAARADALAQGELGAGRRLLAGLERSLIEGTALAGPSPVKAGINPMRWQVRTGEVRKVPVEPEWQGDELRPRTPEDAKGVEIFTVHPEPGAQVRMDDSPEAISAADEAGRTASIETVTSAPMPDAPSTDYYAGVADKRRAPKPETSPADYWSGAARKRKRWPWRKK